MKKLFFAAALVLLAGIWVSCEKTEQEVEMTSAGFLDFSTNGQTLPSCNTRI